MCGERPQNLAGQFRRNRWFILLDPKNPRHVTVLPLQLGKVIERKDQPLGQRSAKFGRPEDMVVLPVHHLPAASLQEGKPGVLQGKHGINLKIDHRGADKELPLANHNLPAPDLDSFNLVGI